MPDRGKITVLGFLGTGRTTLVNLIRAKNLPVTTSPDGLEIMAQLRVGSHLYELWDYHAKSTQDYALKRLTKDADLVLMVVDSTPLVCEKSRFFVELVHAEAPGARLVIVANKQDLPGALSPVETKKILGNYPTIPCSVLNEPPEQLRTRLLDLIAGIMQFK